MKPKNPPEKSQTTRPTQEELVSSEWATIKQLENMLRDPEIPVKEKTGVANVLAFHVTILNKLLLQTGQKLDLDEQNLGDFIRGVEPRIARCFRRDVRVWQRALSLRRS
jgi:hypothetical protein